MTNETDSLPTDAWTDRGTFLNLAGLVEGSLALAALALAWVFGIDLWAGAKWDWSAARHCLLGLIPLVALFGATYRWPIGSLRRIKTLLLDVMGPPLAACRWYDLPLLAGMAGLGEELLFRGVLQQGFAVWGGPWTGLIAASILFGLAHAVTPTYAVLAGVIGLYLGWLFLATDPPNLITPIVVHGLYDLVAFVVLRRDYQRRNATSRAESHHEPESSGGPNESN